MIENENVKLPDRWIKVFAVIGLVGLLAGCGLTASAKYIRAGELERLAGCQAKTRQDCTPSFIWFMAGYLEPTSTAVAQP